MSPYIVGVLIGVLSTVVIWGLTTWREHSAEAKRQREYSRLVLKGAMVDYLAALDSLVIDVYDQQPKRPASTAVDRTLDRVIERLGLMWVITVVVGVSRRLAYGQRLGQLMDRMTAATAHLRLVAPPEVLALMREVDDLFSDYETLERRVWRANWLSVRAKVREGFRSVLDT
jgi:hypothetical protein